MPLIDDIKVYLQELVDKAIPDIAGAFGEMTGNATALNKVFGQNRERIGEIQKAIAETVPEIKKLGGEVDDVFTTLSDVSEATKKNVLATNEQAAKLYAASQITGQSVRTIVSDFEKIGVQFSKVPEQMETSIKYIQSVGLNVSQIMSDVQDQMSNLNKFSFEGGVQGLTKMAANAAIFKFDMTSTFAIAEKALRPDGAIELASAFQRMGVAVGELTDPFQLMNLSLNDPTGLQKSLSTMTKQYAEFDEKTKSFKINPAGMLQMRELSDQTGIQYETLAKSALAAANLDRALGQIKPSINFKSEEDKQLLSSIATMDEKGEYQVRLKGEKGEDLGFQKLSDLTQEQIDLLLKQQKEKEGIDIKDIALQQLDALKVVGSQLEAIKNAFEYGIVSSDVVTNISEKVRDFSIMTAKEINKIAQPNVRGVAQGTTRLLGDLQSVAKEFIETGNISGKKAQDALKDIEDYYNKVIKEGGKGKIEEVMKVVEKNLGDLLQGKSATARTPKVSSVNAIKSMLSSSKIEPQKIDVNGNVVFKVEAPAGVDKADFEKWLNSPDFRNKIIDIFMNLDPNARARLKSAGFP